MKALVLTATVIVFAAGRGVQEASPQDITAAIEQGRAGKALQKKCGAHGENGFEIVVEGPLGRVMRAAREATKRKVQFAEADATSALGGPVLMVLVRRDPTLMQAVGEYVTPGSPLSNIYRTDLFVRSKSSAGGPVVLRAIGPVVYDRKNAPGYRAIVQEPVPGFRANEPDNHAFPGSDMAASFDLAAFNALPPGDVEVVAFMTDAGERTCKISDKDRRALR